MVVTCAEPRPETVHDSAAIAAELCAPLVVTRTVFEIVTLAPVLADTVFDKFVAQEAVVDSGGNSVVGSEDAVTAAAVVELY